MIIFGNTGFIIFKFLTFFRSYLCSFNCIGQAEMPDNFTQDSLLSQLNKN